MSTELRQTAPGFGSAPLWQRAVTELRDWLTATALGPGARLPTERVLCNRLGVSRMTLRKALAVLVEDGFVARDHGRGWFMPSPEPAGEWPNRLESFTETARRMGLHSTSVVLDARCMPASLDEAERFGIAPGTVVQHLDRVRMLDGVPIAVDRSVLRQLLGDDAALTGSLYESLAGLGTALERAEATIEAGSCSTDDAERLGIDVGSAVLLLDQTTHDSSGAPAIASRIVYAGERYRLRTTFARPKS